MIYHISYHQNFSVLTQIKEKFPYLWSLVWTTDCKSLFLLKALPGSFDGSSSKFLSKFFWAASSVACCCWTACCWSARCLACNARPTLFKPNKDPRAFESIKSIENCGFTAWLYIIRAFSSKVGCSLVKSQITSIRWILLLYIYFMLYSCYPITAENKRS